MSKKPQPPALETIDPAALAQVAGGAGTDPAVMQALTGVLDSLKSLSNQQTQGGGFGSTEMMMMMMMMMQRQGAPQQVATSANPYAGYTIDGVFYPFK